MLSADLQTFVNEWRLGHLATVGPEGPNVSPKGTFQALDSTRIAFAEIRSPNTMANLAHDPRVEVNMVDVFARKGARFRGTAAFHAAESEEALALAPRWAETVRPGPDETVQWVRGDRRDLGQAADDPRL